MPIELQTRKDCEPVAEHQILLLSESHADTSNTVFPSATALFNPDLYAQNQRLLRALITNAQSMHSNHIKMIIEHMFYPALKVTPLEAARRMTEITSARSVTDILQSKLNTSQTFITDPLDFIKGLSGYSVPFSPSHDTDYLLLSGIEEAGVPLAEIGLIVLDKHFDAGLLSDDQPVNKSNFLSPLLMSPTGPAGVSVIGLPESLAQQYIHGTIGTGKSMKVEDIMITTPSHRSSYAREYAIHDTIHDKVIPSANGRLILGEHIFKPDGKTNMAGLNHALKQTYDMFLHNGAKHILILMDTDCTDNEAEGITATPYNTNASICSLGIQDLMLATKSTQLPELLERIQSSRNRSTSTPIDQIEYLIKCLAYAEQKSNKGTRTADRPVNSAQLLIDDVLRASEAAAYEILYPRGEARHLLGQAILQGGIGGFLRRDVDYIIRQTGEFCKANGMHFGVPLNSAVIAGSVSELNGQDRGGKTASFALQTAQMLQKTAYDVSRTLSHSHAIL